MTTRAQMRRLEVLEAALGPSVTVEAQRLAECLATELGCTADELIADAARIAALERPGDTPEMVATRMAVAEGYGVDEFMKDWQSMRERFAS